MVKILRDPYPAEANGFKYPGERHICGRKTNFSVIYNLHDNLFWVALGKTPAPLDAWVGLDFKTEKPIEGKDWPEIITPLNF